MIGVDREDPLNVAFLDNLDKVAQVENTLTPAKIAPSDYAAIFYAGGHGTMWDFPDQPELAQITTAATLKRVVSGRWKNRV